MTTPSHTGLFKMNPGMLTGNSERYQNPAH